MNSLEITNKMGNTVKLGDCLVVEVRPQKDKEELERKYLASMMKYAFASYIPNSSGELKGFKEYAEWLASGVDKLEFVPDEFITSEFKEPVWYLFEKNDIRIYIRNGCFRGHLDFDGVNIRCTQPHNCQEHNHLEYFTPIAENWYRRWKLEQLVGKL